MRKTRNDAIPVLFTFQDFHKRTCTRAGVEYVTLAQDPFRVAIMNWRKTHSAGRFSPRQPQNLEVLRLPDSILLVFRLSTSSNRENTLYFFATSPTFETRSHCGRKIESATGRSQTQSRQTAVTELIRSGTAKPLKNFTELIN